MKEIAISIARTLLLKNIAFCIYHLPGGDRYRLAIDSQFLPHDEDLSFWIAPFTFRSGTENIFLSVVKDEFLNEAFFQQTRSFPFKKRISAPLPLETSKEEYLNGVNAVLKDIRSNKIKKAVLSRVFNVDKPHDFDPLNCFRRLVADYPQTFVHLFHHPKSGMWMGATPELLLRKRNALLSVMALAGTQTRKAEGDYLWRKKEEEEQEMVSVHIETIFKKYGYTLIRKEGPQTAESGRVAHLKTDYIYRENAGIPLKDLLAELHPTPAVGGVPVDKGMDCILGNEGYDRRYYCGFIGETDFSQKADIYINLRCMQVGEEKIAIYAGAGITGASDPQEEWEETVLKSKTMVEKIKTVKELY